MSLPPLPALMQFYCLIGTDAPLITLCSPDHIKRNNPPELVLQTISPYLCASKQSTMYLECTDADEDLVDLIVVGNREFLQVNKVRTRLQQESTEQ